VMRLGKLLAAAGVSLPPAVSATSITDVCADSREVRPGAIFIALSGHQKDGAAFVGDAISNGAVCVIAVKGTNFDGTADVPIIQVDDPRLVLAKIAAAFYPAQPRDIVAVTGTNGKSSVASFTEQIWRHLGHRAGSVGTLGVSGLNQTISSTLTSPDPVSLHRLLSAFDSEAVDRIAMEASSHGLDQRRIDGVRLRAGAFTNLSRDHLDYHDTIDAYFDAKLRLFKNLLPAGALAVVNVDDPASKRVISVARKAGLGIITVGRAGKDICLLSFETHDDHLKISVRVSGKIKSIKIPLVGSFQAENGLIAAALAASSCDVALESAVDALEYIKGACGRLELVGNLNSGARVFVDYAHTPDALRVALCALRPHTRGRIIVVFGAGGDRDKGKRELMGAQAIAHSDEVIVTDDNPRGENPALIRAAIMLGAPGACEVADRQEAISVGIGRLGVGDVLLVAGKGHEQGQIVGKKSLPFSDHDEIKSLLGHGGDGGK
jgi:UDP-N-acetylmuramoyl-L-alanyl-D-glutamate--2,6-diaminopimelate ligase